jgi:hypothetical protein
VAKFVHLPIGSGIDPLMSLFAKSLEKNTEE